MNAKKVLLLVLVVFLGLAVLCCGGLVVLMGTAAQDPENIEVRVDAPLYVPIEASFPIAVEVTNTAREVQTVHDVDIADAYLEGITITGTDPEHDGRMHVPIDNTLSYEFMQEIEPGGTYTFTFFAEAREVGDFYGDIDVCVNSDVQFLSRRVRTVVQTRDEYGVPPADPAPAEGGSVP